MEVIYLALIATYCVTIAILFSFYGGRLITLFFPPDGFQRVKSTRGKKLLRFLIITVICTISLLFQACVLLVLTNYTSVKQGSNMNKMYTILFLELFPVQGLILLFRHRSTFTKSKPLLNADESYVQDVSKVTWFKNKIHSD
eukprot:TRINITY_DN15328_c0_g1_i2.p1 TRINITY_DN15328_c0_g1~~TRINITY_DN15328_c0_g1_i2.p1  ORF type:complete len:142 (-),score=10.88 TRINITY_DN15328_c0_g1_i2:184-609(-)